MYDWLGRNGWVIGGRGGYGNGLVMLTGMFCCVGGAVGGRLLAVWWLRSWLLRLFLSAVISFVKSSLSCCTISHKKSFTSFVDWGDWDFVVGWGLGPTGVGGVAGISFGLKGIAVGVTFFVAGRWCWFCSNLVSRECGLLTCTCNLHIPSLPDPSYSLSPRPLWYSLSPRPLW